jgi:enoyl-CoA hydratase/carnithine racemase
LFAGHAFAGGAFIMFSHDYIVMNQERGWLSINEVRLPSRIPFALLDMLKYVIIRTIQTLFILPTHRCKIPLGHAQTEVITFGKRITAKRGMELGIVHKLSAKESLIEASKEIAAESLQLGTLDRTSLGWMKRDLYEDALKRVGTEFNARLMSNL